ncbi:MAG: class I SAM-dependent methyltransferase [Candidatus Njordarchaeia archaeon]
MEQIENKGFNKYRFELKKVPILHKGVAEKILENIGGKEVKVNLTLNKYTDTKIEIGEEKVIINWGKSKIEIKIDNLKKVIKKEKKLYTITGNEVKPLEIRGEHYYKLTLPENSHIPTVEIDGIHMHRIKDVDPLTDTKIKVSTLGRLKRMKLLDICTGLGYTAILAKKFGANVITIEKDINVLKLAEFNPWSHELEEIPIILEDATKVVERLPEKYFDLIIHDPPRFSLAGELYSKEFYEQLYRILKRRGKLFHYTGSPGSKYRGKSMVRGVGERLAKVGFTVRFVEKAQGFIAVKRI